MPGGRGGGGNRRRFVSVASDVAAYLSLFFFPSHRRPTRHRCSLSVSVINNSVGITPCSLNFAVPREGSTVGQSEMQCDRSQKHSACFATSSTSRSVLGLVLGSRLLHVFPPPACAAPAPAPFVVEIGCLKLKPHAVSWPVAKRSNAARLLDSLRIRIRLNFCSLHVPFAVV